MWLEAILTKADLETVLHQFSPLTIRLGDSGNLLLATPTEVSLLPDEGIGIVCDVTLHWPVLGIDVPVTMRSLTLRVLPVIEEATMGNPLVFRMQIDHTGISVLPSIFDHRVTAMVNEELQKKHVELSWTFLETLTHEFGLPASIASAASISLVAREGKVKASGTALGLAVRFETAVRKRSSLPDVESAPRSRESASEDTAALPDTSPAAPSESPPSRSAAREPFDAFAFVAGGAVTAIALAVVGGLARLASPNRRRRLL